MRFAKLVTNMIRIMTLATTTSIGAYFVSFSHNDNGRTQCHKNRKKRAIRLYDVIITIIVSFPVLRMRTSMGYRRKRAYKTSTLPVKISTYTPAQTPRQFVNAHVFQRQYRSVEYSAVSVAFIRDSFFVFFFRK